MLGNCKKENICPDHFPDFNLGSFIIIKSMFIMKNLTDFRKTVETGVNPYLEKVNKPRASKEQIGWGGRELLGGGGGLKVERCHAFFSFPWKGFKRFVLPFNGSCQPAP